MVANIGDIIQYNGKLEYAQNSYTRDLMKKFLRKGIYYKVCFKVKSKGRFYYKFEDNGFWYPYESFEVCDRRLYYAERYGLK